MRIRNNVDLAASFERLKSQLDFVKKRTESNPNPEEYPRSYKALKSAIANHLMECTEDKRELPNQTNHQ